MNKTVMAGAVLFALAGGASAQSLNQQINAVNGAVQQQTAEEQAQRQAYYEAQQRAQVEQQRQEQAREQAAARAQAKAEAKQAAIDADNRVRANKAQSYEDARKELELEAERIKVKRENDLIDAQIAREKAETDVVQSHADATRNISVGVKNNLTDTGEAEVKKNTTWFNK